MQIKKSQFDFNFSIFDFGCIFAGVLNNNLDIINEFKFVSRFECGEPSVGTSGTSERISEEALSTSSNSFALIDGIDQFLF